jgi:glycopeptide antibiotics resistance protein
MIYAYLGDTLYALMMFWIMAFLFPRKSVLIVAVLSLMVCFSIELSQLYQASWIVEIRKTRLGGLVLGFGFLWSDLISYFVGVVFGFLIEHFIIFRSKK